MALDTVCRFRPTVSYPGKDREDLPILLLSQYLGQKQTFLFSYGFAFLFFATA